MDHKLHAELQELHSQINATFQLLRAVEARAPEWIDLSEKVTRLLRQWMQKSEQFLKTIQIDEK